MNPILVLFINGGAWFLGLTMIIVGLPVHALSTRTTPRLLARVILVLGIGITLAASVAPPLWLGTLWLTALAAYLVLAKMQSKDQRLRKARQALTVAVPLVSLALALAEIPNHIAPDMRLTESQRLYVIGDSLCVSFDDDGPAWPLSLGEIAGIQVENLARAGATTEDAHRDQVPRIPSSDFHTVLVEIGGNDLLGTTSASLFANAYEELLSDLSQSGHRVYALELPLPPLYLRWGYYQRTIARRHGVRLLPRRILASVLADRSNTTDGLHLNAQGHRKLAAMIATGIRQDHEDQGLLSN